MNIVRWLLWLMLAFAAMPALAQSYMTTVTAQVKDINGTIYNSCRYSATLVNLSTSTLTLGGTALPDQFKQVTGTQCTASGNLSTRLVANTALIPNNSQWKFTICDSNGANCFNVQTTISGTTLDITALVQSAAVVLPITNTTLLAGNNIFTGNNTHNGTETFNGADGHNGAATFSGGTTEASDVIPDTDGTRSIGSALKRFIGYFTNLYAKWINGIYFVNQYSGADFGAKLTACVADLPANGGTCRADDIIGSQSMASDVTISKARTKVVFGNMTLTMGTNRIIVAAGTPGVTLQGTGPWGSLDAGATPSGTHFIYTGTDSPIKIGDGSARTYYTVVSDISIDVSGAGAGAKAVGAYRTYLAQFIRLRINGDTVTPSTIGVWIDGTGDFTAFNDVIDVDINNGLKGVVLTGPATGTNANHIVRGHITGPGKAKTGTMCIDIQTGDHNDVSYTDCENVDIGINVQSGSNSFTFPRMEVPTINTHYNFTCCTANYAISSSQGLVVNDLGTNTVESGYNWTVKRSTVLFRNFQDEQSNFIQQCGLTVSQQCGFIYRDWNGTNLYRVETLSNRNFEIFDVANNVARFSTTSANTALDAPVGGNIQANKKLQALISMQIGPNGSTLTNVITATATLTYTAIAAQTCQEQPVTVTNSSTTNFGVYVAPRATLGNTNLSWSGWVSVAGTVQVRVCNPTAGSITPSAVAWGVTVTQ